MRGATLQLGKVFNSANEFLQLAKREGIDRLMVIRRQVFQLLINVIGHFQFNSFHLISPISLSSSTGLRISMPNSRAARRCRSLNDTTKLRSFDDEPLIGFSV